MTELLVFKKWNYRPVVSFWNFFFFFQTFIELLPFYYHQNPGSVFYVFLIILVL